MSNSTFTGTPPLWQDVIHDFKNKINPAFDVIVGVLEQDDVQANLSLDQYHLLKNMDTLLQRIEEVKDAKRHIGQQDPDEKEKKEKIAEYLAIIKDLNELAERYVKLPNNENNKKVHQEIINQFKFVFSAIKKSQMYLETISSGKALSNDLPDDDLIEEELAESTVSHQNTSLKTVVIQEIEDQSFQLNKRNNSVEIKFNPPNIMENLKKESLLFVQSIFENCIANSNRFMENGKIVISVNLAKDGNDIQFIINDNGVGMPPHILESVQRGEVGVTIGGNGVGLAGVQRAAKALHGSMLVESTTTENATIDKPRGTTFTWTLPTQSILDEKYRVYFVDDILINRKVATKSMEMKLASHPFFKDRHDIRFIALESTKEILEKQDHSKTLAVITDLNLGPGDINGLTFATIMRSRLAPNTPIATYSGNSLEIEKEVKKQLEAGVITQHIQKGSRAMPQDFNTLLSISAKLHPAYKSYQAKKLETTPSTAVSSTTTSRPGIPVSTVSNANLVASLAGSVFAKNAEKLAKLSIHKENIQQELGDMPAQLGNRSAVTPPGSPAISMALEQRRGLSKSTRSN